MVNQGATAEFGRSAGGFVNVVTRSGTNDFSGTAHYYGQWDAISAAYPEARGGGKPEFGRGQFGFTLGGPDRARPRLLLPRVRSAERHGDQAATARGQGEANLRKLDSFLQSRWPGLFDDEFGPVQRTDDARALIAKLDFNAGERHQASFKYNYTWSEQVNGTFDVDSWGLSSNGIERDYRTRSTRACVPCSATPSPTNSASSGPASIVRAGTTARSSPGRGYPGRPSSRGSEGVPSPTSAWISRTASASACPSSCPSIRGMTVGSSW